MGHQQDNRSSMLGVPVVVIIGPTAVGKTELSLELARRFPIEIINADSRYLYRGLDIGTAKPTAEEQAKVRHHLVDILDPNESYSLGRFLDDATAAVEEIASRGHLPVVVGGTPQYLRAFVEGWKVPRVAPNPKFREGLASLSAERLHERLIDVDPEAAERIGDRNKRRLIRALEVYHVSGKTMTEQSGREPPPYKLIQIGLRRERDELHARIEERAREHFENGLLEEARNLLPYDAKLPAMSSISYPEARAAVLGEISVEEAIERTCYSNNRYVRHQETWFRRFDDVRWFDAASPDLAERVAEYIASQIGDLRD